MYDLTTSSRARYVCEHLKHPDSGTSPVVVLKPADFAAWSCWRRPEAQREQAFQTRLAALYRAAGVTPQEAAQAQLQATSYQELAQERAEGLEALDQRAQAGEDVADEIRELEAEDEASASAWKSALDVLARLEVAALELPRAPDTLDSVRHTFELVLGCIERVEGVTAGGKPLVWQDAALADLGLTREGVLSQLLGAEGAVHRLYQMASLVTQGLSEQEKKA